jgi:hypothetical protein
MAERRTSRYADGYIDYKQIIKVIDEDDPEFTIPAIDGCIVDTDCDTDIPALPRYHRRVLT